MNVSFKARLEGFSPNLSNLTSGFENLTKNDTKHSMEFQPEGDDLGRDVFVLKKNGVKTAEYATHFEFKNLDDGAKKLLKIFNMLKIYEAQAVIKNRHAEKVRREKEEQFHSEAD